jgi:hypothetical protein
VNPLNAFQRTMLQWERLHPYNAVHALQILGPARPDRLRLAIHDACSAAGIGKLHIDRRCRTFAYEGAPGPPLELLPATNRPHDCLSSLLTRGTNHCFATPGTAEWPLAWSVFAEADATSHWLILAYRHVVSDAHGVQLLLAETLAHYLGGSPGRIRLAALPKGRPAVRRAPWTANWRAIRQFSHTFRSLRYAHKMDENRDADDRTECAVLRSPLNFLDPLVLACRRSEAGLNDACLASLASTIAERTQDRHKSRRRRKLALGSILSLRPREITRRGAPAEAVESSDRAGGAAGMRQDDEVPFGPELADMVVLLDEPDATFEGLLAEIVPQTRAARMARFPDEGASEATSRPPASSSFDPRLFLIQRIWPVFRMPHHRRSYRKVFPLCGGVSTFAANEDVFGSVADRVLRYVRVAPPGPALPIVLAPTVFRGRLELTLTFRVATLSPAAGEQVLTRIVQKLQAFALEIFGS